MKMIIFILAMVLSGCGGGGGSSPTPTTTPTTTPTPTPGAVYTVSGTISGGTVSGVTITSTPGGVSAVTGKGGKFTLPSLPDGSYVVTPSAGSLTFLPTSTTVLVNGKNISGVDFSNPLPELKVGTLMYPCTLAFCEKDLATGDVNTAFTVGGGDVIGYLVPLRTGNKVAYYGPSGLAITSVMSGSTVNPYIAATLVSGCGGGIHGFSIDNTTQGNFLIVPVECSHPGEIQEGADVFVIELDGTSGYIRVSNSPGIKTNPVAGPVNSSGMSSVFWIKVAGKNFNPGGNEKSTIMQQIVDTVSVPTLVGAPAVFEKDVVDDSRGLSLNASRTKVAFVKVVDGVHHIFVKELSGGKALDLGPGDNPYWSLEKIGGSTLILCSLNGGDLTGFHQLQAVRSDGTKRWRVSVPAGFQYDGVSFGVSSGVSLGVSSIVFAPPAN